LGMARQGYEKKPRGERVSAEQTPWITARSVLERFPIR
jgi:hypothetical protein